VPEKDGTNGLPSELPQRTWTRQAGTGAFTPTLARAVTSAPLMRPPLVNRADGPEASVGSEAAGVEPAVSALEHDTHRTRPPAPARLRWLAVAALLVAVVAIAAVGATISRDRQDSDASTGGIGLGWRAVGDPDLAFDEGSSLLEAVIPGGPGAIASAFGLAEPVILTTADGLDWVPATVGHDGDGCGVQALTAGGPGYVAVGICVSGVAAYRAAAWTSVDGMTWSQVPDSPAFEDAQMAWVVNLGEELLAVGVTMGDPQESIAWMSSDGIAWSRVALSLPPGVDQLTGPVVASGRAWAVGWPPMVADGASGSPVLISSPDGRTWVQSDAPLIGSIHAAGDELYALVSKPGTLVPLSLLRRFELAEAVANGAYRLTPAGTWQPVASGLVEGVPFDVVDADGTLVVVGTTGPPSVDCDPAQPGFDCPMSSEPQAWRSTGGGQWESVAVAGGEGTMEAAAPLGDGTVVAVGRVMHTIATSDAKAWVSTPTAP
jgi:hypothetical protein